MKVSPLLIFFSLFIFFPIVSPSTTFALNKPFNTSVSTYYNIENSGNTKVIQKVEITNKTEYQFVPSYEIHLSFSDIQNVKAYTSNNPIPIIVKSNGGKQSLLVSFKDRVVGMNKKNTFTVEYETYDIAKMESDIWDVNIPGVYDIDNFDTYTSVVSTPSEWGKPSIVKPPKSPQKNIYTFKKEDVESGSISLIFGDSQYYSYTLFYHLKNDNLFPVTTEIALPPDTTNQNVLIENISPKPNNILIDEDGNWLAQYSLDASENKNIQVDGYIKVNASTSQSKLSADQIKLYTRPLNFWENDVEIKKISEKYNTPEKIYNYVVSNLKYDYQKVTDGTNRLGAKNSLVKNASAVCLEFTDLFIAISRASGIPARSVEGFAYSTDRTERPLALRQDILHAWPEYYDFDTKKWVMVDPTWENTTRGTDYFSATDLNHIAFVIKGKDSSYPIPAGGYKDDQEKKDVIVKFADSSKFNIRSSLKISSSFPDFSISGLPAKGKVTVYNTGNYKLTDKTLLVLSEGGKSWEYPVDNIPPNGKKEFEVHVPTGSFLTNTTHRLKISIDDVEDFRVFKTAALPKGSNSILIGGGVFLVIIITVITITIKTRRIFVS